MRTPPLRLGFVEGTTEPAATLQGRLAGMAPGVRLRAHVSLGSLLDHLACGGLDGALLAAGPGEAHAGLVVASSGIGTAPQAVILLSPFLTRDRPLVVARASAPRSVDLCLRNDLARAGLARGGISIVDLPPPMLRPNVAAGLVDVALLTGEGAQEAAPGLARLPASSDPRRLAPDLVLLLSRTPAFA